MMRKGAGNLSRSDSAWWGGPLEGGPEQVSQLWQLSAEEFLHGLIRVDDKWEAAWQLQGCRWSFDVVAASFLHDGAFWHIAITHSGRGLTCQSCRATTIRPVSITRRGHHETNLSATPCLHPDYSYRSPMSIGMPINGFDAHASD